MNKNIKNIIREKLIINNLVKKNIFRILKKSISQNNNLDTNIKIYNNFLYVKNLRNKNILSKHHKVCLITGKRSSIITNTTFSRYMIKNLILNNKLTNFKKLNW